VKKFLENNIVTYQILVNNKKFFQAIKEDFEELNGTILSAIYNPQLHIYSIKINVTDRKKFEHILEIFDIIIWDILDKG